jgi:general secretion pathway protein I
MWPKRAERQGGFSLLELLVAFTILATVITVLLQVFAGGLRNLKVGDEYTSAVAVAEARLAELGRVSPIVAGAAEGRQGEYLWQLDVRPWDELVSPVTGDPVLFDVRVTVRWQEAARERRITLATLRFVPEPEG